ncbi:hypothetical protein L2K70_04805 [Nocardioides KLBMP 9356]|uniref:DUF4760 domain-containing protein n=1 Tax=Nocardioides potassii TaxID=2911371 RepID=A0ABS9H6Q5_9ACTN|nr:hypothetical protein [Nocardioides potassii]MCF6376915.1 hypothetical protein [Nocardioides potassii]
MIGVSAHDGVDYDGYSAWWIWMLEHGLDGIVGGLLAVAGVAGTLWYDRHARAQTRKSEQLDEVRQVVGRVLEKALDANSALQANDPDRHPGAALMALDREIRLATPHLYSAGLTDFAASLQMHGSVINYVMNREQWRQSAGRVANAVLTRCQAWLRDPDQYTGRPQDRGETIAFGDTVLNTILHPAPAPEDESSPES